MTRKPDSAPTSKPNLSRPSTHSKRLNTATAAPCSKLAPPAFHKSRHPRANQDKGLVKGTERTGGRAAESGLIGCSG